MAVAVFQAAIIINKMFWAQQVLVNHDYMIAENENVIRIYKNRVIIQSLHHD